MMVFKMVLMTLVMAVLVALLPGCASSDAAEPAENQVVTVQRGDLTVDITASGNLVLSTKEDLAFEISGIVAEVLVAEGDTVIEGQVLAKLDTSEWEDELDALESQLTAAERQLTTRQRDLLQAEINIINAEITLDKANDEWLDTVSAGYKVKQAKRYLEFLKYESDVSTSLDIHYARESLEDAWDDFLSVASESRDVSAKEMAAEVTQGRLEDARIAIEDAQQAIEDAQQELDEAQGNSLEITATFDGFITMVNVDGGDEVKTGTVAVQLADPAKFEADILVSEVDIFQVELGGAASVQVDAMPGMNLPAKVTHISPTATIQSGVVNYEVKVEIQSLQATRPEGAGARPGTVPGELPERLRQAIEEGRLTREQAAEMMRQRQPGQGGFPGGRPGGQPGQIPAMAPEDFQLREGLTVTVSILVEERNNVLLVPNQAVTRQGSDTLVQVMKDGVIEPRVIETGISNWQYTEVTDGLSEGEPVVIPQGTATTPTTPQGGRPSFIPGRSSIGGALGDH